MNNPQSTQTKTLFRIITNKLLNSRESAENLPKRFDSKKADSPGNFPDNFQNLLGAIIWLLVLSNSFWILFLVFFILPRLK